MLKVSFLFSTFGLGLDIIGAIVAASGFFATKNADLFDQAGSCWGYNSKLFEALVEQRDKATYGLLVIFGGFLFQFGSSVVSQDLSVPVQRTAYLILLVIFLITLYFILQRILSGVTLRNINSIMLERDIDNYLQLLEKIKDAPNEQIKQSKTESKREKLHDLAKRLSVPTVTFSEEELEKIVLEKAGRVGLYTEKG